MVGDEWSAEHLKGDGRPTSKVRRNDALQLPSESRVGQGLSYLLEPFDSQAERHPCSIEMSTEPGAVPIVAGGDIGG